MKRLRQPVAATVALVSAAVGCAAPSTPFWQGQTDPGAVVRYEDYDSIRGQVDGWTYAELVNRFGPGRLDGHTDRGHPIFVWQGNQPGYESGALMVVCDHDGSVRSHYYVMP